MDNAFLYKEYEECFTQLRFYDERQMGLVNFVLTLSSTAATLVFGFYKIFEKDISKFLLAQNILSLIIYISTTVIIAGMIQNRIYFTICAKQINAIRKYMLKTEVPDFKENQMYVSTNFRVFKFFSVQTLMILGVLVISVIYLGSFIFSLCEIIGISNSLGKAFRFSFIFMGLKLCMVILYFKIKSQSSADKAIHGEKVPKINK